MFDCHFEYRDRVNAPNLFKGKTMKQIPNGGGGGGFIDGCGGITGDWSDD